MADCFNFAKEAKNRVTIQQNSGASDNYGGTADSWASVGNGEVWAVIKPLSDSQVFQSQQLQSRVTHKIITRYQSALKDIKTTARYRMTFDSRSFDIKAVKNMDDTLKGEGRAFQVFTVEENGPDV